MQRQLLLDLVAQGSEGRVGLALDLGQNIQQGRMICCPARVFQGQRCGI